MVIFFYQNFCFLCEQPSNEFIRFALFFHFKCIVYTMTENGFLLEIAALEEKKAIKAIIGGVGHIVVDSVKIKLAFTNRIPYATNLLNYSIVVTIFFIPTLTAYICSKSDWSHISSQIFRFAVFYPTQQGIQHTPDFSPLCFLFSKMKDNISSKQPLLTFHHYMSSIVVVAK